MKVLLLVLALALVACSSSSSRKDDPAPIRNESSTPAAAASPPAGARCLPVYAKECGCVYSCGAGVPRGDGTYDVTHSFWKGTTLRARPDQLCLDGTCTDVFAAEIVCAGICAPKPPDRTCHFEADRCVGAPPP